MNSSLVWAIKNATCKTPGQKIRSGGKGRGLAHGQGEGPVRSRDGQGPGGGQGMGVGPRDGSGPGRGLGRGPGRGLGRGLAASVDEVEDQPVKEAALREAYELGAVLAARSLGFPGV